MQKRRLTDTAISSTIVVADNENDPIVQISSMFNDGTKIASVTLENSNTTDIFIPMKVVNSTEYDPATAIDGIIYFIKK